MAPPSTRRCAFAADVALALTALHGAGLTHGALSAAVVHLDGAPRDGRPSARLALAGLGGLASRAAGGDGGGGAAGDVRALGLLTAALLGGAGEPMDGRPPDGVTGATWEVVLRLTGPVDQRLSARAAAQAPLRARRRAAPRGVSRGRPPHAWPRPGAGTGARRRAAGHPAAASEDAAGEHGAAPTSRRVPCRCASRPHPRGRSRPCPTRTPSSWSSARTPPSASRSYGRATIAAVAALVAMVLLVAVLLVLVLQHAGR